ncbi:J-type co-chaperone JAC1, mitochondrial [Golovinomyces cichoracearum]|uniref:J-type co-chaperone JAC1, mitochondrial n=1 Tax=Golovinomyces cichoracearum TaxID=62708 RepID=A0A420IM94_9PEZI|nr:J-type co-chaperone JAC1, mitochondrial [Golovinomyces cichoracearum]
MLSSKLQNYRCQIKNIRRTQIIYKINDKSQNYLKTLSLRRSYSFRSLPRTHYDLFPKTLTAGPPPSGPFHIDTRALRREFLQLQALAHPDRHATSSKQTAEQESALINEAYKTLQSPLSRAQYLLSLRNFEIKEWEAGAADVDSELLRQVMETREAIENAAPDDKITLRKLKIENDERIKQSESVLSHEFGSENWQKAKTETIRLKYWMNIKSCLDEFEMSH